MSIHQTPKPGSGMTGARGLCRRALRASEFGLLGAASLAAATAMRPPPAASVPAATPPHYGFIKEIRLAGDGGWDYLSIDPTARRLYVAHGDHIDVVDIDHDTVVGSTPVPRACTVLRSRTISAGALPAMVKPRKPASST